MSRRRANLATGLKTRRRSQPVMQGYDRLPPELRRWLADAALPWSPRSALKLWQKAMAEAQGCPVAARAILERAQARLIARDAAHVWGPGYPAG